ncbi:MAG: hypothetical protein AB8G99_02225 [Planctomycetaceae bacterium]
MALCDQGYICEVCGEEVKNITVSDLYLRFVIGELDARALLASPERHLRCNPSEAQFIVDEKFEPVVCEGVFGKDQLDSEFVKQREELVTRGWKRLQELPGAGIPISEYPLEEFRRSSSRDV